MAECFAGFADGIYLMGPVRLVAYSRDTLTEWVVIPDIQGDIGGLPLDFAFNGGYTKIYIQRLSDHVVFEYSLVLTATTITATFLGPSADSPDFGYDIQSDGKRYGVSIPHPGYYITEFPSGANEVYFATYPWAPGAPGEDPNSVASKTAYPGFDEWSSIKSYFTPGRMYILGSFVDQPPPALYAQVILENTVPPTNPSTVLTIIESAMLKAHGYIVPCGTTVPVVHDSLVRFSARNVIQWMDTGL